MTDSRKLFRRYRLPLGVAAAVMLTVTAFGGASSSAAPKAAITCSSPSGASGGKACPNIKIIEADSIPETSDMTTAAEQMIGQGAKIIFSTSYGYKDYAVSLAKEHSDVAILQQGNFITPPIPPNANTYFGNVYETVYLAGIAAGKATKTNKLGFVAAFPIPQTLLNINAFELGALSVNPKVKTYTVFTGSWCDPGKQADAASSLLSEGADVLTQHQDCTGTVIKAAEAKGAFSVGYHYDAQSLAPKGWLTGSDWNWAPLYEAMVGTILDGKFTGSQFNANYSLGFSSKTIPSPMNLAPYGPSVKVGTKVLIAAAKTKILSGWSPFTGPIIDQSGKIEVKKGKAATGAQLASMGYLVKGVIGSLPK
jgi:basic membrane protein A and related proteins